MFPDNSQDLKLLRGALLSYLSGKHLTTDENIRVRNMLSAVEYKLDRISNH